MREQLLAPYAPAVRQPTEQLLQLHGYSPGLEERVNHGWHSSGFHDADVVIRPGVRLRTAAIGRFPLAAIHEVRTRRATRR